VAVGTAALPAATVVAAVVASATLRDAGAGPCTDPAAAVLELLEEEMAAAPVPAAALRRRP